MDDSCSRRAFLAGTVGAALASAALEADAGVNKNAGRRDFAMAKEVDEWLHHPVIGDPSFDTFAREPGNPIFVGSEPYWWPVNGTLFHDPVSGAWFAFVSVYPRGYFGQPGADIRILREKKPGEWEDVGLVFGENVAPFVRAGGKRGASTDGSVVYDDGRYHLLYGWANPENKRGGLGYAWAERPEGPYHCAPQPVDDDSGRKPILGRYVRAYASTLIRREHDWLILHMMSTPGNAGGTWGLFCMTSPNAGGPCSEPTPLVLPQSDIFHPPLAEFFPAYVVGDRVYAPATSVAANRSYQSLFSAPLEQAHRADAWRIERLGSLWHQEPVPWEARGIWGQTFAVAPAPGDLLRAMFPCKTAEDIGTISIARRPLRKALKDGFVLAGPNGPSHAILRHAYGAFTLDAGLVARGPWHLAFGCREPLGPNHPYADSRPHALMGSARTVFCFSPEGWELRRSQDGTSTVVASGPVGESIREGQRTSLRVQCGNGRVSVKLLGQSLFDTALPVNGGRIELVAEEGGHLTVERFAVSGSSQGYWEDWLATEALAGAACAPDEWKPVRSGNYRYGEGFVSARPGARAKFNFDGTTCELYGPLGPHYGTATITIDGKQAGIASFNASAEKPSDKVFVANLKPGRHALVLTVGDAVVPLDCLRVLR